MKTTIQVLQDAKALITKPQDWCQRASARDIDSVECYSLNSMAVQFCALGALNRAVNNELEYERGITILYAAIFPADRLRRVDHPRTVNEIANWNDDETRTHEEVIAAFDKATEFAKAEAKGAN